jgi:hypothetical protein
MVILQQDELEAELANSSAQVAPIMAGKEYVIVGVVDGSYFKASLKSPGPVETTLAHASDFKTQYGLSLRPGRWYKQGQEPPVLPATRPQFVPTGNRVVQDSRWYFA